MPWADLSIPRRPAAGREVATLTESPPEFKPAFRSEKVGGEWVRASREITSG
jgi:hypothetical protein